MGQHSVFCLRSGGGSFWRVVASFAASVALFALAACSSRAVQLQASPPPITTLATGGKGGTFLEFGQGMAREWAATTATVLEVRESSGSFENIRLLQEGKVDLALVAVGPAHEALTGTGSWTKGQKFDRLRAVAPMYETPFHLGVRASSVARTLADLKGLRVGVGPAGGPGELIFQELLKAAQIPAKLVTGTTTVLADQLIAGELDALFLGAGVPVPAFSKVASTSGLRLIPIDGAVRQRLAVAMPYVQPATIVRGVYAGTSEDCATFSMWNFVMAHPATPPAAVVSAWRSLLREPAAAARVHAASAQTTARDAQRNTIVTVHPAVLDLVNAAR